jgi:hypothetical protein
MPLFADEQVKTRRLENDVKDLNESLRTQHNQVEEVTDWASEELDQTKLIKQGADRDLMQAMKTVTDVQAQLERVQGERNMLWDAMKPLALLFRRPEDGERRWVDIVRDIPNCFESYVQGVAKICIRNVLGTLRVLYLAVDLHQVAMYYEDEGHLATVEKAEIELNGLATSIANDLDLRMEKPHE